MNLARKITAAILTVNLVKFAAINLTLMMIIGFLTLDSNANLNSRIGAYILSFLLPYFIVHNTMKMSSLERILKFGVGWIVYIILCLILVGLPYSIDCGIVPCLIIAVGVLYFGEDMIPK